MSSLLAAKSAPMSSVADPEDNEIASDGGDIFPESATKQEQISKQHWRLRVVLQIYLNTQQILKFLQSQLPLITHSIA